MAHEKTHEPTFTETCFNVFERAVADYHITDNIDALRPSHYPADSLMEILYHKNWIDVAQWHMEDLIRDPEILPLDAVALKRRIDASNQERTDMVEELDTYFRNKYADVKVAPDATINTESPAWAFDRLSILAVKIYHMRAEVERPDAPDAHRAKCAAKLDVLLEQRADLIAAIDMLLDDIAAGRKYMKVYRQMKMYNDADTNPVLYAKK